MKPRISIIIVILIIILIGIFTRPDMEKFSEFISRQNTEKTAPIIQETNGRAFSLFYVTYYHTAGGSKINVGTSQATVAVPGKKETWMGLFGRFWKI